jgi:hypothetical protein
MKINLEYEPRDIAEGTFVRLAASPPSDYRYAYKWWAEDGAVTPADEPGVAFWDTRDLGGRTYRISVNAEVEPGQQGYPEEARTGDAEITLSVRERSMYVRDFERMASGARDYAQHFKQNIDSKLENLTDEVSRVATGVGNIADHAAENQPVRVVLQRSATFPTTDQGLWPAIRLHTDRIAFDRYSEFINRVLCAGGPDDALDMGAPTIRERRQDLLDRPTIHGVDSFEVLRTATEVFLILECGLAIGPGDVFDPIAEESRLGTRVTPADLTARLQQYLGARGTLPYLARIVDALLGLDGAARRERLPYCDLILRRRFTCPSLLELIWSYWHEEGMLVQTLNVIALRFQNRSRGGGRDPLAHLAIDPLRPLNNLLWGYVQSEYKRLSVPRRAYEYDHHYGLSLYGKAVPVVRSADSRSKFLEAFHNLLYRVSIFYHEDADTTVIADGFPLLTALREVHLILAEGAHNQFGDLPWTARVEMLIEQWLLARPEIQAFLRGRAMVPYREAWMGQVDTMKRLQGWTDTTITHFNDLATWGEQIILSIRYGDWIDVNDQEQAKNWARYWRPEVQGYIHAYRAATGVDLAADTVGAAKASERYLPPSVHLRNRLVEQQRRAGRA